jgi:branched-chain amino acid transport system permease protein
MCDNLFFNNSHTLGAFGQAIDAPAPSIIGLTLHSRQSFVIAGTVLVLAFAVALQLARRGRFGRALTAMRDSPSAASALGLSLIRTKLLVFAVSAGMAGLAGCLYAGLLGQVGGSQFTYLVSLTALLILAIQGVTAVPGAIIGGAFYALLFLMLPEWVHNETAVSAIQPLSIGLAVLGMVARPEGVWPTQARAVIALFARLGIGPPAAATGVPVGTGGAAGGRELAGSADTSRPAAAPLAAGGGTTTGATTSGGTTSGGTTSGGTGGTTETAATSAATTTATSGGR